MPDPTRQSNFPACSAFLLVSIVALFAPPVWSEIPQFVEDNLTGDGDGSLLLSSDNGVADLHWGNGATPDSDDRNYELQQAADAEFKVPTIVYRGPNRSSYRTGLGEGTYFFRVRFEGEPAWSDSLRVKVSFIERSKLWLLLGVGLTVTLLTGGAILIGHRKMTKEESVS